MNANILCIEDHPDNMLLIRRLLSAGSYNLLEAQSGVQGLDIAENQHIDLVLLDINLPDIDGYEIARRLRSNPRSCVSSIPIIAVTANAMKGDAQKVLSVGCDAYMSKPIDIQDFLEKVERLVSRKL